MDIIDKVIDEAHKAMFKYALFKGKVKFDYAKANGTICHTVGTMNVALLPKSEQVATFKCTNIKWYTAEPWPKQKTVQIPLAKIEGLNEEELRDLVADEIPNACGCGFVVKSFKYKRVDNDVPMKKMPNGSVFYYDFEKKGFHSFKLANLKEWKVCQKGINN